MCLTWNDAVSPGALVAVSRLIGLGKLLEVPSSLWDDVFF